MMPSEFWILLIALNGWIAILNYWSRDWMMLGISLIAFTLCIMNLHEKIYLDSKK